jgi:branched-chain amino acid transport system ATP-binding protein
MPSMVSQIAQIVGAVSREGVSVLLVEQNVPLTLDACRRIYFIEKGVVRHQALASELQVDHPVIHQYLGV